MHAPSILTEEVGEWGSSSDIRWPKASNDGVKCHCGKNATVFVSNDTETIPLCFECAYGNKEKDDA